jgi:flagellar basal body P-ring protein FlgI
MIPGCAEWFRQDPPTTRPAGTLGSTEGLLQMPYAKLLKGTVAEFTYVEGLQPLNVRGFGLVTGLDGQGSRNCPPAIRERIAKEIRRRRAANPLRETNLPPAEKLIDSLDTAVVRVDGQIPPGAAKKRTFDATVRAVDPDTNSIAEGYVQPCNLHIYAEQGPARTLEGRIWARAAGTVFINPFAGGDESATNVDPREGVVIGGGLNLRPRTLSLVSVLESYSIVRQIRDTINRRFPADEPVADAVNPTHVTLTVPPAFHEKELRFLEIIRHLPLTHVQAKMEARAKWLASELTQPEAPVNQIALCLEGLGQIALPMLQPLYAHPRPAVNYAAARTGLRLGDGLALDIVAQHAKDPQSPYRRQAIREMGACDKKRMASGTLRELLADPDPRIQVEAYEALRKANPEAIWQVTVGRNRPK